MLITFFDKFLCTNGIRRSRVFKETREASHHCEYYRTSNLNEETNMTEESKGMEFNTYVINANSVTSLYGEIIR
ncbi:hypothetical protein RhiirA4_461268 [Rhizophagus irregularis]|uniref:Uncharacterized protein n=1 Tax=Rhizophagus irregularis TaxID=588596 RepID=A0A2I1GIH7_9GLOM|nr:hypothetical protein RhiirA4_461268 [Rhizophagus irregularis]